MGKPELDEIREILSEFENRISFLENSLPGSAMSYQEEVSEVKAVPKQEPWDKRQEGIVNQLRGEMANLKRKFVDSEKRIYTLEEEIKGRGGNKYVYK